MKGMIVMKYETPQMEVVELDCVFTLIISGESDGSNEDYSDIGKW